MPDPAPTELPIEDVATVVAHLVRKDPGVFGLLDPAQTCAYQAAKRLSQHPLMSPFAERFVAPTPAPAVKTVRTIKVARDYFAAAPAALVAASSQVDVWSRDGGVNTPLLKVGSGDAIRGSDSFYYMHPKAESTNVRVRKLSFGAGEVLLPVTSLVPLEDAEFALPATAAVLDFNYREPDAFMVVGSRLTNRRRYSVVLTVPEEQWSVLWRLGRRSPDCAELVKYFYNIEDALSFLKKARILIGPIPIYVCHKGHPCIRVNDLEPGMKPVLEWNSDVDNDIDVLTAVAEAADVPAVSLDTPSALPVARLSGIPCVLMTPGIAEMWERSILSIISNG